MSQDASSAGVGLHRETLAVRLAVERSQYGENSEALYLTSGYVQPSAEASARRFAGEEDGYTYGRSGNPTVTSFEQRLAAMEGAESRMATSSGMAAVMLMCFSLLKAGDHVICSRAVFGSIIALFEKYVAKFAVEVTFVDLDDLEGWKNALQPNTRLLFIETPSNPLAQVGDMQAIADIAHAHGALFAVDNCFCTPALQQPIKFGADLVLYSATKYIDGQGRALGGAVVGKNDLLEEVNGVIRTLGNSMSPFNAWIFLKGLETLSLRMKAHCASAQILAEWLKQHDKVEKVYYAGLPDHPGHELAKKQQKGFGGVVSFVVRGERQGAWTVIDNTRFLSITSNLGDVKSTITHPATTSHGRMSAEAKQAAGIEEGLIRVSVGLEDINDIIRDLSRGLDLI